MRLQQLIAMPHPAGNRIRLHWQNPAPDQYPGVRVLRREDTHPVSFNDGIVVAEGEGITSVEDSNLKGETVYYYTLFPYSLVPRQYLFDPQNRASAMAIAPYNAAGQMYHLLPSIYHRYDTESSQLRRFLDLPGAQFDEFYSFASALLNTCDLDRLDGRLLPLLAEWIGWQTNYRLEIAKQRNEIRYAPYLYQSMGLIPTLEATVKRIIGWESRTKEFVHNVLRSNCPERLNLWLRRREPSGIWSQPTKPLSLNFAYAGRVSAVRDQDNKLWLFYHTLRQDRWEIWYKTYTPSDQPGEDDWSPSQPLNRHKLVEQSPTAAWHNSTLWIFWSIYLSSENRWQIHYRTHTASNWSAVQVLMNDGGDRRQPWAVTDTNNGLWLFWLEVSNHQQTLKYTRHDGNNWQLESAASFVLPDDQNFQVEDVFVLAHPNDAAQPLWVFWARQEATGTTGNRAQTRWQIAYRVKAGLDPTVNDDWSEVRVLPWANLGDDDREPTAQVRADGTIELFWSSTRSGAWSIWQTILDTTTHTWSVATPITTGPYSHRAPLCIADADQPLLIYRSNQSVSYSSQKYGATKTTDFRYVGSTTVDTRNLFKLKLREQFDDLQTYTAVVSAQGRSTDPEEWYAWYARRDAVGLYLTPTTEDPDLLQRDQELLRNVLPQFLPIQVRTEFFLQPAEAEEIYNTLQTVTEFTEDVGF